MSEHLTAEPREATKAFVEEVCAKHGEPFVKSWLSEKTCRFGATSVHTIGLGVDRLAQSCGDIAAKHAVQIVRSDAVTRGFYAQADRLKGAA